MSALGHVEGLQHQREDQPDGDTGLAAHASLLEGERVNRGKMSWAIILGRELFVSMSSRHETSEQIRVRAEYLMYAGHTGPPPKLSYL